MKLGVVAVKASCLQLLDLVSADWTYATLCNVTCWSRRRMQVCWRLPYEPRPSTQHLNLGSECRQTQLME